MNQIQIQILLASGVKPEAVKRMLITERAMNAHIHAQNQLHGVYRLEDVARGAGELTPIMKLEIMMETIRQLEHDLRLQQADLPLPKDKRSVTE